MYVHTCGCVCTYVRINTTPSSNTHPRVCERARAPGRVYNAIAVLPLRDVCITLYYSTAARGVRTML